MASEPRKKTTRERRRPAPTGESGRNDAPAAAGTVVGIGASAGGVEALSKFFDAMPPDSGLAFVVVLHLDPTHESRMAELLSRHTAMPVREIADGMKIAPNHVYMIAPDQSLTVGDGLLHISKPTEPRGRRRPVDVLFASLAEDRRERAICIVLSGTGTNGTHGLKDVKAQGGCVFVQDPATTRFDGMPRSAIDANLADHVLAPEKMPEVLLRYMRHAYFQAPEGGDAQPGDRTMLDPVLALLRLRSGHEFRGYKRSTLLRRVHRRMGLHNQEELDDYADLLRTDPGEVTALVKDLMISVTGFFRDPEAWKAFDETALGPLIAERQNGASVRIWVPACASGEEAYTLAMLLAARAEAAQKQFDLKVFATDSQEDNLNAARAGVYPEAAVATIPERHLRRFFHKLDGSYEVKRELRELVTFAPQNLLRDPPFSRLDLVTCRNLLIYLEPEAQQRAIALFHFALREGGHLFLGGAEGVGRQDDLFETVSKKWRIYRRLGPTRHDIVNFPVLPASERGRPAEPPARPTSEEPARIADLARRELLERFAPASVLIDGKGRALHFHGPTGDFLEPPPGEPTRDLLAMARDGLRAKLRAAVREAGAQKRSVSFDARIRQGEASHAVAVTVAPVNSASRVADLLLVSFERNPEPSATAAAPQQRDDDAHRFDRALEDELKATRAELQSAVEQLESANEELKAANEEATSMNEELQSTNEELETSKEELQSYNEELYTINNQLQHKIQEVENANDDLSNLLSGTEIATIFLDDDFRIKWFSPTSRELLDLQPSDIGRPLGHFALKVSDGALLRDAEAVLARLTRIDVEIQGGAGRWFLRRLLPYRTRDNRIAGVVATYVDITERKRATDAVEEARLFAEAIVATVRHPLLVLNAADLRVVSTNPAFQDLFRVSPDDAEGRPIYELGNRQWDIPELRRLLSEILPRDSEFNDFEVEHRFEDIGRRIMLLNARRMAQENGRAASILLAIEDVTELKQAAVHQEMLVAELSHRVKNTLAAVQSIASLTLSEDAEPEAFAQAFEGRLHALGRVHGLLVDADWAGGDIGRIARETLDPYADGADRIAMDGPELVLKPEAGVSLAMILHELATNAAKYGALSTSGGRLAVTWRLDGGSQVHLRWIETGGPRPERPLRRGFGSRLIEQGAAHELRGAAKLDFSGDGLRCELTFPWLPPPPRERHGLTHAEG